MWCTYINICFSLIEFSEYNYVNDNCICNINMIFKIIINVFYPLAFLTTKYLTNGRLEIFLEKYEKKI